MRTIFKAFFLLTLGIVLIAYFSYRKPVSHTTKPVVVVTFSVLEDLTKQLLKNTDISVETFIDSNCDPHHFEPSPKKVKNLKSAELIIANGLGLEPWLENSTYEFPEKVVYASSKVDYLKTHNHEDPHAWLDVKNVLIYIENIKNALQKHFPKYIDKIEKNYQNYKIQLQELDKKIKKLFADTPEQAVLTAHKAFSYFEKAYGLRFLGLKDVNPESDLSAQNIKKVVDLIRAQNIKVIFSEDAIEEPILKQIQEETGIKIGGTLYVEKLPHNFGYINMMDHNAQVIHTSMIN